MSKLIKPVIKDNKEHYEVQWKGYSKKHNTIEPRDNLLEDVAKMVDQFEKKNKIKFYEMSSNRRKKIVELVV